MTFEFINAVDKGQYIQDEIFKRLQKRSVNVVPSTEIIQEIVKEILDEFPELMPETKIDVEFNKETGTIKMSMRIIP